MKSMNLQELNWDKLRSFYLMAQYPTLSHAAIHMKMTQSALSRSLADLEKILGMKLFERRPRGMHLLREGQDLVQVITKFFHDLTHYDAQRLAQHNIIQGQLRLAIAPLLPVSWLIQDTAAFLQQYPGLEFRLIQPQDPQDAFVKQADCAIQEYDAAKEDELIQQPLVTLTYGLYAAKSYLESYDPIETLDDLKCHAKILLKTTSRPAWGWPEAVPYTDKGAKIHELTTAQDVLWAAQQGLGIAALPHCQGAQDASLEILPFYLNEQRIKLCYSYPKHYHHAQPILLYGDCLKRTFGEDNMMRQMRSRLSLETKGIPGRRPEASPPTLVQTAGRNAVSA